MHQIGNSFTRLPASIGFFEYSAAAGEAANDSTTTCVLGVPAAQFETIHCPALVNAWHDKLQRCLLEPVQLEQRKGHRRVNVLGTAVFDFDTDGVLTVYGWDFDENDRVMLREMPAHTVVIQGAPYQSLWMERYKLGALRALQQRHPDKAVLCRSYVAWVQTQLAKRLWTQEVQDSVRYQIAIALDLDIWAVSVASQIQVTAQIKQPMRGNGYNLAIRYRKDFETLQTEAPKLLPLYALLAGRTSTLDHVGDVEVTAWMQQLLVGNGIQPAMWRLLCRVGAEWMKEFLAFYDFDRSTTTQIATDILTIAQAFGTQQLVPPAMMHAFMQLGGNPNAPHVGYTRRLDDMFPFCARLGHLLAQADGQELAVLQDRSLDLFNWATDHLEGLPQGYLRRATLRGLLRKVDLHIQRESLRQQSQRGWDVPYTLTLKTPDLEAVILDSPLAIWTEGQTMHHCAASLTEPCAQGKLLMVSVRDPSKGRPLATVTFDMRSQRVAAHKLSGFANTLVKPELRTIALECCRQLQQQRIHLKRQHAPTVGATVSRKTS